MADDSLDIRTDTAIAIVRLEAAIKESHTTTNLKLDALKQAIEDKMSQVMSAIDFGDRTNATSITFIAEEARRAHGRIDSMEDRLSTNTRLVITAIVVPLIFLLINLVLVKYR